MNTDSGTHLIAARRAAHHLAEVESMLPRLREAIRSGRYPGAEKGDAKALIWGLWGQLSEASLRLDHAVKALENIGRKMKETERAKTKSAKKKSAPKRKTAKKKAAKKKAAPKRKAAKKKAAKKKTAPKRKTAKRAATKKKNTAKRTAKKKTIAKKRTTTSKKSPRKTAKTAVRGKGRRPSGR
jgi:hypothetical protein